VLTAVHIPWTREHEFVQAYKQAHRREDDIALVNAGMRLFCCKDGRSSWVVKEASIVYGGVGPTVAQCKQAEAALVCGCLGKEVFDVRS
jgi:xanthine dehydrogenase/oxidase